MCISRLYNKDKLTYFNELKINTLIIYFDKYISYWDPEKDPAAWAYRGIPRPTLFRIPKRTDAMR